MHRRSFENTGDRPLHARHGQQSLDFHPGLRLLHRLGFCGLALVSFCLLAGCVDSITDSQAPQTGVPDPNAIARRPGINPGGATVAVASFIGGPDGVKQRFMAAFDNAARAQDIVMATPDAADYLVRGYLNATQEGNGTAVTYVLDVFDAKKHRTERLQDEIVLNATAPDPWSVVDDSALSAVAAKSAAGLAAVLTNTPQAIAASQTQPATNTAQGQQPDPTIVASSPTVGPPGNPGSALLH
jgi:hypothetical protein